jgi:capsular exopolysaccharide synthesis family protein
MNRDFRPVISPRDFQADESSAAYPGDHFSAANALRFQFERYRTALRKRWWIPVLSLLLVGAPAVVYAVRKPAIFRSEAIMWLTARLALPGGERPFFEEMSSYMSTQGELLKSPAIQLRAFRKISPVFPELAALGTNISPESIPFDLTVVSSPKHSVLSLEAKGRNPEATRAFLNAVMDEYLQLKNSSHQQASAGALSGISDQLKDVERQSKQQQAELIAFEKSNNIAYLTEHGLSAGSHLSKLDELLSDLRTEHRLLETLTPEQFIDASRGEQNSFSDVALPGERAARAAAAATQPADAAYYQALQQMELLKAKRDEFAKVLRPSHSKMVKLNQEISGLEQLLNTLKTTGGLRALAQMENRKKSLELQIESLESQHHAWESNAVDASSKLAEHERLRQELQRSQALYDRLLGLVQTVDLNRNLDQEPLSPLAPAGPAQRSLLPKLELGAGGVVCALMLGLGLLVLLEAVDDRFISAAELTYQLPEEVVGQIPETRLNLLNNGARILRQPEERHAFVESFRGLRSSLFFMFDELARPRLILFTSSVPKEGKSTVAAHLAASLAMSGSRVLLVDADLRRSSLHRIFGVGLTPGLREVLAVGLPVTEAIVPVQLPPALLSESGVVDSASAKLFLLPAGESGGDGSAELLLSKQAHTLLRELSAQYDYVLIDSPPMLATDDAIGLATKADGVFMVVRASYTYSRMVREALERLRKRHVRVLGLVYNRAAPSSDYYYRYSRDYHQAG